MSEAIYDVFISYSSKNHYWVMGLAKALKDCGFSVWWDRELFVGSNYYEDIENALKQSRCVVTVWSEDSVKSKWVLGETSHADKRDILVPVIYQVSNIPLAFHIKHNADLQHWGGDVNEKNFQQLLRGIEQVLEKPITDTDHLARKGYSQLFGKFPEYLSQPKHWAISSVVLCVLVITVLFSTRTIVFVGDGEGHAEIDAGRSETNGVQVISGDIQITGGEILVVNGQMQVITGLIKIAKGEIKTFPNTRKEQRGND